MDNSNTKAFKAALANTNNLQEFFDVCGEFYDLKGVKLGSITKAGLIAKIDSLIMGLGAKLKK